MKAIAISAILLTGLWASSAAAGPAGAASVSDQIRSIAAAQCGGPGCIIATSDGCGGSGCVMALSDGCGGANCASAPQELCAGSNCLAPPSGQGEVENLCPTANCIIATGAAESKLP